MTRVKFCGIARLEDAQLAAELGVWAIGLNFWAGSPRRCPRDRATEIAAVLRRRLELVGVFVNAPLNEVTRTAENVGLTMVQLHGEEGPAYCAEVARRTGCRVIKAVRVRSGADIQALESFHTDCHLLDSYVPGSAGGTGETFAWELARAHRGPIPLILSGGLRAENVAEAIGVVRPFAVDVASGIEPDEGPPTRKDPEKMQEFVRAASSAAEVGAR